MSLRAHSPPRRPGRQPAAGARGAPAPATGGALRFHLDAERLACARSGASTEAHRPLQESRLLRTTASDMAASTGVGDASSTRTEEERRALRQIFGGARDQFRERKAERQFLQAAEQGDVDTMIGLLDSIPQAEVSEQLGVAIWGVAKGAKLLVTSAPERVVDLMRAALPIAAAQDDAQGPAGRLRWYSLMSFMQTELVIALPEQTDALVQLVALLDGVTLNAFLQATWDDIKINNRNDPATYLFDSKQEKMLLAALQMPRVVSLVDTDLFKSMAKDMEDMRYKIMTSGRINPYSLSDALQSPLVPLGRLARSIKTAQQSLPTLAERVHQLEDEVARLRGSTRY